MRSSKRSDWGTNRLSEFFNMLNKEIYDIKELGIHGGSIRVNKCRENEKFNIRSVFRSTYAEIR